MTSEQTDPLVLGVGGVVLGLAAAVAVGETGVAGRGAAPRLREKP